MDNKKVTMIIKEIKRVEVMTWVDIGKITGSQAAKMMGIHGWLAFGAIGCFAIGVAGFFTPSLVHIEDNREKFI
jgi:hypothetical protein